jgi:hypothetical protein
MELLKVVFLFIFRENPRNAEKVRSSFAACNQIEPLVDICGGSADVSL